ncbi:hypothetical protein ABTX15_17930 [Micromonospora sp. NPDC094482]|uniref:hypothetical protein n=1 Tax=unclassified Micromonospora TaxID=2617518 RepID=UPI00332D96F4
MSDEGVISLLAVDEPADADAEVLVLDDLAAFAADFVLDLDRAWQVVEEFARTAR